MWPEPDAIMNVWTGRWLDSRIRLLEQKTLMTYGSYFIPGHNHPGIKGLKNSFMLMALAEVGCPQGSPRPGG